MKPFLGKLAVFALSAAALVVLADGTNAAQNAKDKKAEEKVKPADLEKTLLAIPEKMGDRDEWSKAWQKYLILGFRASGGRDSAIQAINVENLTPCTLSIKPRELMYKDGTKTKVPPPEDGWEVLPGKKLYLGLQLRLATVPIKQDMKPGIVVDAIHQVYLAVIHATPNNTEMKPIDLVVMLEYGERGNKIVGAKYSLFKPDEEKDFLKR